jgi:uncharacterized protein YjbJ (UPF0337 family)
MKALTWIVAGTGVGIAAYIILNQPGPVNPTGDADVEQAAGRTSLWGSKQRLAGNAGRVTGRIKEGVGRALGDEELAGEGATQQVVGAVKDTAGKVAQAAGETLHDLNR